MRAATILSMAVVARAAFPEATRVTGNPAGVVYQATLPAAPFFAGALSGNIRGSITAVAPADGNGVQFTVHFENIPKSGGPFPYHLHVDPVVNGNCTATLAHLDPTARGEKPPCDEAAPATCQVGDLSGKYGKVTTDPYNAVYVDPFASLKEGDAAFVGNRSFVVHFANATRITCASFARVMAPNQPGSALPTYTTPTGNSSYNPTGTGAYGSPTVYVNPARANGVALPLLVAAVVAAGVVLAL